MTASEWRFSAEERAKLERGMLALGVTVSEGVLDRFGVFAEMLVAWNERLNLTRIPPESIVTKHFLDSLSVVPSLPDAHVGGSLLDLGTGGGFPGIPIALVDPKREVILVDAHQKRLDFLNAVIGELPVPNAKTLHGRGEELGRDLAHRERYDVVCARAVAELKVLLELSAPLTRVGGMVVAMKGPEAEREMEVAASMAEALGLDGARFVRVEIPEEELTRSLVIYRKIAACDGRYPRRWKQIVRGIKGSSPP